MLGLMGTGAVLLAAIVGAIWLEARMPTQPERRLRPPAHLRQPSLMIVSAGSQRAIHEVAKVRRAQPGRPGRPGRSQTRYDVEVSAANWRDLAKGGG